MIRLIPDQDYQITIQNGFRNPAAPSGTSPFIFYEKIFYKGKGEV
jgi:hypothetical protein